MLKPGFVSCAGSSDSQEVPVLERNPGLLTRLLGPGGDYEGYKLRFVGHSLGGSIAALTALRVNVCCGLCSRLDTGL